MLWKLSIFVSLLFFTSSSGATCPNGSITSITDNSICYFPSPSKTAFLNAEEICIQNGGHLVSIHSAFENEYIKEQAQLAFTDSTSSGFWIGFSDLKNPGIWSWMDESPVNFVDWGKGQPTNLTGADCSAMNFQGGTWISDQCDSLKSFFCAKKVSLPTTTTPLIFTTTTTKPKTCENSWKPYENFCYKIITNKTWIEAENACFADGGGHLASIHSLDENNFITNLIPFNPNDHICDYLNVAWIGLFTVNKQVAWEWIDDTVYNFSAWAANRNNQPSINFCTYLWNGPPCKAPFGTWGDGYCENRGFGVCKKPI